MNKWSYEDPQGNRMVMETPGEMTPPPTISLHQPYGGLVSYVLAGTPERREVVTVRREWPLTHPARPDQTVNIEIKVAYPSSVHLDTLAEWFGSAVAETYTEFCTERAVAENS